MAEAFLFDLLQTSNSVQSDIQGRNCVICLQETGKMCRETGLIELQLRLPCGHTVGSGCISTWLRANNSCPLCRQEFFPAQPRPYLEYGIMDGQEDEDDEAQDGENEDAADFANQVERLLLHCREYHYYAHLDYTDELARRIVRNLARLYAFSEVVSDNHSDSMVEIVALGVYIAFNFGGRLRSPREICMVMNGASHHIRGEGFELDGDRIRELYGLVYDRMDDIINDDVSELLHETEMVWPSRDLPDKSDDEIECDRDLPATRDYCTDFCDQLRLAIPIRDLSQHIAANLILIGFREFKRPGDSDFLFLNEIAAVSIYIASHLLGQPISERAIQNLRGGAYSNIRSTYRTVRDACDHLVDDGFCETRRMQLSWETLEADIGRESEETSSLQRESINDVPATMASRVQQTVACCELWWFRRNYFQKDMTTNLAQQLAEKFANHGTLASRAPVTIAAACVYIACACTNFATSYRSVASTLAVDIFCMHYVHMIMVQEIASSRVNVQDMLESLRHRVSQQDIVQSLPQSIEILGQ